MSNPVRKHMLNADAVPKGRHKYVVYCNLVRVISLTKDWDKCDCVRCLKYKPQEGSKA